MSTVKFEEILSARFDFSSVCLFHSPTPKSFFRFSSRNSCRHFINTKWRDEMSRRGNGSRKIKYLINTKTNFLFTSNTEKLHCSCPTVILAIFLSLWLNAFFILIYVQSCSQEKANACCLFPLEHYQTLEERNL